MATGFYWTANSPYIRAMWVRVRRAPRAAAISANVLTGFIPLEGTAMQNANPAYIIYECLTDTVWGMGDSPDQIDAGSFAAAANTLLTEQFGLFVTWVKQDTIENFVSEILDHIQAVLFIHPATGLWTLKLLRADYDVDSLQVFDPDNADITDFDRKVWGETINEIAVTWTNPVNEQAETVTIQDLANVIQQGGQIVSQSRNYYGIRSVDLARRVAARDLRTACSPLSICKLKAFRSAWNKVPGDCIVLNWPEEGADGLVMRVQQVDYGSRSDGYVNVALIEDIFSLDAPAYVGAPETLWQPTTRDANKPANVKLFTAPAFLIANPSPPLLETIEDPEVIAGLLVADPNPDFINVEPYTASTLPNGDVVQGSIGTRSRVGYGTLMDAFVPATFTNVMSFANASGARPRLASLVFIGAGGDTATEIALVQAVDAAGVLTLARGVLDTVPQAWPAGTPVWFVGSEAVLDVTARAPGETVVYRPLMRTSVRLLPYDAAEDVAITLSARPYLPLRPANVKLNGTGFGAVAIAATTVGTVTWARRNRMMETSQILNWGADDVSPESGQTTTVEVLDGAGAVLRSYAGLTGTTTAIPAADLVGGAAVRVAAVNARGRSLQSHMVRYTLP